MGIGELLGSYNPADLGLGGIVTLFVVAILLGWLIPKKQLDRSWAQNDKLQQALETQGQSIATLADAVADLKVTGTTTLYALQEIQAAAKYASQQRRGIDPP